MILFRTAERRYDSRPQQAPSSNQYEARSNDQQEARSFRFPSDSQQAPQNRPQYQSREVYDDAGYEYPPQQPYYLANDHAWTPLPRGYLEPGPRASSPQAYPWEAPAREYMPASPPRTSRQQMGFVVPEDHDYDQRQQRSGGSQLSGFAQQALTMAMAGAQGKSGKKGDGMGKGSELLAGLFSK